jgi:hypothetical protein
VTVDAAGLRDQLQHVFWIGGGSRAGKSTVARRLAASRGLRVYATDDVMSGHASRSTPEDCPFLNAFMAMDLDERWVNRSPETMLDTFHWYRGEGFDMIVDDLLRLPRAPSVIVEGFRLLPRRVKPLAAPGRSVWLLPTPAFRRAASDRRAPAWAFLDRTSDPDTARQNLLERDRMFTDRLREQTTSLGLSSIDVDTATSEEELAGRVADALGL